MTAVIPLHPTIGIGLVASKALRDGPHSVAEFLGRFAAFFTGPETGRFAAVGGTYDAVRRDPALAGYRQVERLPNGRLGGVVTLVARVVDPDPAAAIDWVVSLLDPTDPTSLYPEMLALKRQCVVHGKPFLATAASAAEWCTLEWAARRSGAAGPTLAGPAPTDLDRAIADFVRPAQLAGETIALIAHDARKRDLMEFVARHHGLLSRFGRRLATGTTGLLLNGRLPPRMAGTPEAADPAFSALLARLADQAGGRTDWAQPMRSGPLGGDAQIANEVLSGRCRRVIFFEDPHVSREHEADIQLMERAARIAGVNCLCLHNVATAERWAQGIKALLPDRDRL